RRRHLRRRRHRRHRLLRHDDQHRPHLQRHAPRPPQGDVAARAQGRGPPRRRRRRRAPRRRRRGPGRAAGHLLAPAQGAEPGGPGGMTRRATHRPRKRDWERSKYAVAAVLSGCLWFLACADFDIWPLAWFAALPMLYAVEKASTGRRAVLFGWIAGTVANAGGFYWITKLLTRFAHLSPALAIFAYLLMCVYQAIEFALFAWIVRRLRAL